MKAIFAAYDRTAISSETIRPDYIIYAFAELIQAVNHFLTL